MHLLMLSGDRAIAHGQAGPFLHMLEHFAHHWTRIDIIVPNGGQARTFFGKVHIHPTFAIVRTGKRLMRDRSYDLVVSHDYGVFYNGLSAWRLSRGVAWISEIHHVEGYPQAVTRRERLYRWLAMRYIRWVWRRVAAIRVVNQHEMPSLLRQLGVPAEKILVLPSLYVDFARFSPQPNHPKTFDVLFVGRLASNKGIFTLLEALTPDITLGVRGDGPLKDQMMQVARQQNLNITLIPHVDDLATVYHQARLLVCASTAEGGPRVTIEAMACGIPVISTPVGVMPDVIQQGENGFLFEWDAADLAQKIRFVLDHPEHATKIGEAGRQSIQHFAAVPMIDAYASAYKTIVKNRLSFP